MATNEEDGNNNNMYEEDEEDVVVGEEEEEETDEDLDEEEEEEEEEDEDEEDLHSDSLTTTAITATIEPPPAPAAIVALPSSSSVITTTTSEDKKPSASALDDSRRLFQRLWTDEDEIGLLQGFLEFTTERGFKNSAYHHDMAPFYDQIKSKLQLDFNKNQLVEKLRRLKKKYRNVMNRISLGKDIAFKTPHDQATFEISRKIWSGIGEPGIEDEERNHEINGAVESEKKVCSASRSRKRSRSSAVVAVEENLAETSNLLNCTVNSSLPNVIEDTVRSCLSPLFKDLLSSGMGMGMNGNRGGFGSMGLSPLPLSFGGNSGVMSLSSGNRDVMDDKWRKQQILELEVYAKRMELVQEQIKLALEELRSTTTTTTTGGR